MSDNQNRYWHYTTAPSLNQIMESGGINVATLYVPEHEQPVVWFSTNPNEEKTTAKDLTNKQTGEKLIGLGRDELFKHGVPQARIEVTTDKVKLFKWMDTWQQTGIKENEVEALMESAVGMGASPDDWWYCFESIPISAFENIDVWNGNEWRRHWSQN